MSVYYSAESKLPSVIDSSLVDEFIIGNCPSHSTRKILLDCTLVPQIKEEQEDKGKENHPIETNNNDKESVTLSASLNQIKEIEEELILYRNTIYAEKLEALQDELTCIEKEQIGTHKTIREQDRILSKRRRKELTNIEIMYEYELSQLDNRVEYEKSLRKSVFARQILDAENNNIHFHPKKKIKTTGNEEEQANAFILSSSYSDTEEDIINNHNNKRSIFRRIHLKKKVEKLVAIQDRHKTVNLNKKLINHPQQDSLTENEEETENDFLRIKQSIINTKTQLCFA
ncbi:uncharacterized protein BX663DRAFT_555519 [Cokeromyces recurvatus]|uniref:uncharacterized protein n=1 Tax=Cokeromyces recurvatus TaxID=90255 RepID=UPI0022201E95|nr:uncharacterized protein BX663DRAFT_555519 [Cokeromyces recurvatus]KAI7898798.1 hypothetical protein BX663DRAFT_555519 [Cokeromyces recurvatus]